jgi:predicted TIM-barrel fold metal-dependent hydrolase
MIADYSEVMIVIDADSHYDKLFTPGQHPLQEWVDKFPRSVEYRRRAMTGDLAAHTPAEDRPPAEEMVVFLPESNTSAIDHAIFEPDAGEPTFVDSSVEERLAWMDKIGIDVTLVNPGSWMLLPDYFGNDRPRAVTAANDFLADELAGATDRLVPVAMMDFEDLDFTVAELKRMRERGSRAFWVEARPVNGMSPAHPDWDKVWGTATDLGMIALLHIGNTPAAFNGWGNAGWMRPNGGGMLGYFFYANAMRHQAAEMMLASMVYGGVFNRHPNLTIVLEELLVGWVPSFVDRCDSFGRGNVARRNIRATPLPGLGDQMPLERVMPRIPEMMVFSSDYPHAEGNANPIELFEPELSDLDPALRASFMGENLAECFARMGDPIMA